MMMPNDMITIPTERKNDSSTLFSHPNNYNLRIQPAVLFIHWRAANLGEKYTAELTLHPPPDSTTPTTLSSYFGVF
jgi:hypothetical protein